MLPAKRGRIIHQFFSKNTGCLCGKHDTAHFRGKAPETFHTEPVCNGILFSKFNSCRHKIHSRSKAPKCDHENNTRKGKARERFPAKTEILGQHPCSQGQNFPIYFRKGTEAFRLLFVATQQRMIIGATSPSFSSQLGTIFSGGFHLRWVLVVVVSHQRMRKTLSHRRRRSFGVTCRRRQNFIDVPRSPR